MSRVSTTNPFDLLGDENEDRTNVPAPKKEQKPAAPAKPAAKPAAAAGAVAPKPEAAKAPAKPAESKSATGGTHSANQVVKPAPPRDANQNLQEREKESRPPRDKRDGPRQPRPVGDGKRANDRKSGTGRPQNEVKKGGQGKGNWGGEVDAKDGVEALKDKEEKVEDEKEGEQNEEKVTVEGEKKETEAAKEGEATKEAPKEEPETMTYEEYLAKKKKSAPKLDALKPRTVNDQDFGAAGLVPLQRGEDAIPPINPAKDKREKKPKEGAAAAKPAEAEKKEKGEKKQENLAAKLLTFTSHQDQKRAERGPYRGDRNYDGDRRNSGDKRQGGGGGGGGGRGAGFRAPRDNRPYGAAAGAPAASQPPTQQNLEKDFPSLSPHGSENPVKA